MKKEPPKVEDEQIAILRDGKSGVFWKTLKKILQNERKEVNATILELGMEKESMEKVHDLIKWYDFLGYVVNLPDACIESLETKPVKDDAEKDEDNDPYEKEPLEVVREKITKRK